MFMQNRLEHGVHQKSRNETTFAANPEDYDFFLFLLESRTLINKHRNMISSTISNSFSFNF